MESKNPRIVRRGMRFFMAIQRQLDKILKLELRTRQGPNRTIHPSHGSADSQLEVSEGLGDSGLMIPHDAELREPRSARRARILL